MTNRPFLIGFLLLAIVALAAIAVITFLVSYGCYPPGTLPVTVDGQPACLEP